MKTSLALIAAAFVLSACGGGTPPPAGQPAVVTSDGTAVPLPTEDGELQEGETTVEQEGPGDDKTIEVDVDDD
jgi:hypothetical protein